MGDVVRTLSSREVGDSTVRRRASKSSPIDEARLLRSRLPAVKRKSFELDVAHIQIFPWPAKLCTALCIVTAITSLVVFVSEERLQPASQLDDTTFSRVTFHARCAILLIIQAAMLELSILFSSWRNAGKSSDGLKIQQDDDQFSLPKGWRAPKMKELAQRNLGDCMLSLLGYALKVGCAYHFFSMDLVGHKSLLSPDKTRTVFVVRHVQWSLAVPTLVLLGNRSFLSNHMTQVQVMIRSTPGMLLALTYIMASWVMEVSSGPISRDFLMLLVLVDFAAVSTDQLHVAISSPETTCRGLKMFMLLYQISSFGVYGMLYLLSYMNFVGFVTEQTWYCYMDAMVKAAQGCIMAMIRTNEDFHIIQHWWSESVAARKDLSRLLKQAKIPIFTTDLEGHVTSWNTYQTQLTGFEAEAIEGADVLTLVTQECRAPLSQALTRCARPGSNAVEQLELIFCKNASTHEQEPGNISSSPTRSGTQETVVLVVSIVQKMTKEGVVEGFIGIGQDMSEITELKAVEQRKDQLMSVVSHELRSPLHGMIGLTNMMEQGAQDGTLKKQLGMVKCCACRLLDLVTNIMDLTEAKNRERRGVRARNDKSAVNFAKIAEEVVVMTMMATDKAGKSLVSPEVKLINLLPEVSPLPIVLGNPYKCTQLLYNLVTNACKFTSKGSVTISGVYKKEASLLEISVEDTGPGIAEEALERIFQPFEQERGHEAARSFEGMGLGLAVCQEVVQLHKGKISVRSKLGAGTTFAVTLPCEDQTIETNEDFCLSQSLRQQREQEFRRGRGRVQTLSNFSIRKTEKPIVLSVDDDTVNQEVINNTLHPDCEIVTAMNGNEALEYMDACQQGNKKWPDLVLLDIQMPGLTGFEVLTEIRRKHASAHTVLPVIMVSAKAPPSQTAIQSYREGCSDYLTKPFSTDVLRAKVRVALEIKNEISEHRRAEVADRESDIDQEEQNGASSWEEEAKAARKDISQALADLSQAQEKANDAETRASKQLMRAESLQEELRGLRAELEESRKATRAAQAAAERAESQRLPAAGRSVERLQTEELGRLRAELEESRKATRAAEAAAERAESQRLHAAERSVERLQTEASQASRPADVLSASTSDGIVQEGLCKPMPWLYHQLQERDMEVVRLNARLATQNASTTGAMRQLETVIQAARLTKSVLDGQPRLQGSV